MVLAVSAASTSTSHGALVANYDFSGGVGSPLSEDPAVTAGTWISVAGFSEGFPAAQGIDSGMDNLGNAGYDTGDGFMFTRIGLNVNTNGTQAAAFADGEYFEVTIAPDAGQAINYNTLSFYAWVNNKTRGADEFAVTSSITGHNAANILGSGEISPSGVTYVNALAYDIDLSGSAFQNVATSETFRIYLWDAGTNQSGSLTGIDNLVFDGLVFSPAAVPEPSSLALLGLAGFGILIRRRRSCGFR